MLGVDFVRDLCRLPGQVKTINKKTGAVTGKNLISCLVLWLFGGLSCAFWSIPVGAGLIVFGLVALMANRETAKFIVYVMKIGGTSVVGGGGAGALAARMFGGEISVASPWIAAPALITFLFCFFILAGE